MNRRSLKDVDVSSLVADYRTAAVAHGVATERGDYKGANVHHDTLAGIYNELRVRGDEARAALIPLLDDIAPCVRAWAAAHALEFEPDRGEAVLKRLASAGGIVGMNAEMTLEEWKKGSLRFP